MEPAGDIMIPEWLLWEVLLRLPSKSAVRFKLVSKQWASLISDPSFVRSYLSRNPWSWTVIRQDMIGQSSVSFIEVNMPEDTSCSRKNFGCLRVPNNIETCEMCTVFGASNGLILFGLIVDLGNSGYVVRNVYYLCNPETGELIPLPPPPTPKFIAANHTSGRCWGPLGLVTRVEGAVLRSFRVVLLLPPSYAEAGGGYLRLSVYASETLQWDEFVLPCEILPGDISSVIPAVLDSRIMHWVTIHGSIIAYDPYANPNHIRVIAPPPRAPNLDSVWQICDATGGKSLRCFEKLAYKDDDEEFAVRFRLWDLEDYYGLATWRLSHDASIRAHVSRETLKDLCPTFFDPLLEDGDILYLSGDRGLASYHVKTGKLKVLQDYTGAGRYNINNLVPPWEWANAFLVQTSPWPISMNSSSLVSSYDYPSVAQLWREICQVVDWWH